MLELNTDFGQLRIYILNMDNQIEFETTHDSRWLSIDQTKQLIDFLTKQIEGK